MKTDSIRLPPDFCVLTPAILSPHRFHQRLRLPVFVEPNGSCVIGGIHKRSHHSAEFPWLNRAPRAAFRVLALGFECRDTRQSARGCAYGLVWRGNRHYSTGVQMSGEQSRTVMSSYDLPSYTLVLRSSPDTCRFGRFSFGFFARASTTL
jgi:hypothetical protein